MTKSSRLRHVVSVALLTASVFACSKTETPAADTAAITPAPAPAPAPDTAMKAMTVDSAMPGTPPKYDKAYVATKETVWTTNPSGSNPTTGPIAKGATVHFSRDPNTMATWQDAHIVKTNTVRFVHPNDFAKP